MELREAIGRHFEEFYLEAAETRLKGWFGSLIDELRDSEGSLADRAVARAAAWVLGAAHEMFSRSVSLFQPDNTRNEMRNHLKMARDDTLGRIRALVSQRDGEMLETLQLNTSAETEKRIASFCTGAVAEQAFGEFRRSMYLGKFAAINQGVDRIVNDQDLGMVRLARSLRTIYCDKLLR